MAYIIPNQGDQHILSAAFQGSATLILNLFKNDVTLTADMLSNACTLLTGGGYTTGLFVAPSTWCVPYFTAGSSEVSASGHNSADGFKFTFTAAPNESAYGYVISNTAANKCIVVEKFASFYYLQNAGDTITLKPKVRAT